MKLSLTFLLLLIVASLPGQLNISQPSPVNVSQMNGIAVTTGNGISGTGVQRVAIASDNTANSNPFLTNDSNDSATGSAVPAKAGYLGGIGSGNLTGLVVCDTSATLQMTTATTTQIVALTSAQTIRVCGFTLTGSTTATATTAKFVSGTGTNCATGQANVTNPYQLAASSTFPGMAYGGALGMIFNAGSANALCITSSAAGTITVLVTYTKY
jgi:hypothetical protein